MHVVHVHYSTYSRRTVKQYGLEVGRQCGTTFVNHFHVLPLGACDLRDENLRLYEYVLCGGVY